MTRHRHASIRLVTTAAFAAATAVPVAGGLPLPIDVSSTLQAAGPAAQQTSQRGGDGRRGQPAGDEKRETRLLSIGTAGSLELKTPSGDITVVAGTARDVSLEIVRRVRARSADDVRDAWDRVKVVVDHQGERASVSAVYEGDRRAGPRVDVSYVVTAPPGTRVTASTLSGNVTIRNIKGDLSAMLASGSIEISGAARVSTAKTLSGNVTVLDMSGDAGMTVGTASGNVLVDRVRARRVDIEAMSGSIVARDVASDRVALRSLSGAIDFSGELAKGGRYEFQSHSGSVGIALGGPAGFELQATTFSGAIRAEPSLGLRSVTAQPRSLRGTSGDGSAVVVATTFNGNVVVTKK